ISLAIMVGLWILVFLGVGLNAERKLIARNNLILPTVLFGAAVLGIGISYLNKRLFAFLGLGLFILVSFDMLRFANKWIPFDPKSLVHPSIAITEFYPKISSSDRVHGNFGAENTVYYRLPGIEGYDAVYNRRYGEFIKAIETGKVTPSPRSEVIFSKNGKYAALGLDFLGIKYIVHKVSDDGKPWSYPFNLFPPDKFDKIFDDGVYRIFEAKDYVPRAFLTSDFVVEADEQKIIDILFSMSFDRSRQIILEENPGIKRETNFLGSAKITNYTNNKVEVQTESSTPSLLFLSDVWYPGWIARIDGQSSKIYRADYTFRAVTVPEGKHKVEFIYNPQSFRYGVSLAGLGALGLFSMLYFVRIKDNGRK
ncbi:MAG: YfhO family protein, partial [Patescibacteria group bacterium]